MGQTAPCGCCCRHGWVISCATATLTLLACMCVVLLCRNDNQINNRKVLLLSRDLGEHEVYWKDVVAGDLIKVGATSSIQVNSSWVAAVCQANTPQACKPAVMHAAPGAAC